MDEEIWKTTERLNGFYEVSNLGRVRRSAPGRSTFVGRILKPRKRVWGYVAVALRIPALHPLEAPVHRLVCEAFHGPPLPNQEVNHKNSDKLDNRSENLEWATRSENLRHSYRTGSRRPDKQKISEGVKRWLLAHPEYPRRGSQSPRAKLNEQQVKQIRQNLRAGERGVKIAQKYGVSSATISDIKIGRYWRHIA